MTLQSLLRREGWRQQTMTTFAFLASAQTLCRNCLSRRLAIITTRHIVTPVRTIRAMSTTKNINHSTSNSISRRPFISRAQQHQIQTTIDEGSGSDVNVPGPIQQLRTYLYDPPFNSHTHHNEMKHTYNRNNRLQARVNNTIIRRIRRIHVVRLYREIRQDNYLLAALTPQDIEAMIYLFSSSSPATTTTTTTTTTATAAAASISGGPFFPRSTENDGYRQLNKIAAEILYDLSIHHPTLFNRRHAEMLVSLYASYGETAQAEKTMQGLIYNINGDEGVPSMDAYDALVYSLALKGDMEGVMAWLKNMETNGLAPTSRTIRSIVDGWLRQGDQVKAIEALKIHGVKVLHSIRHAIEQGQEDLEILGIALKQLGHEAINDWLLGDARRFYHYCQERGIESQSLVRHLVDKSLYTFQATHAYDLLADTKAYEDKKATDLVSRKLLKYYLARGNLTYAFRLWSGLSGAEVAPDLCIDLFKALAHANRHEQLMRLYRFMKKRYPTHISIDLYNAGLQMLVRTRSYANALTLYNDMIKIKIPPENMPNGMFYSLYGLCARTGDTKLFRDVLERAAEAGMEMDNKALSSLMACYIQADDLGAAKQVFEAIAESHGPDVVDFNLLIRATAKEAQNQDTIDFSKILKILQHMSKVLVEPNASTYRTLLDIYREGQIEHQLFERLLMDPATRKFDEVFLNNIALTREIERQGPQVATSKFMRNDRSILFPGTSRGVPIHADSMTYKILLDALTERPKYMSLANKLYQSMRAKGWLPYKELYEQMILGWARKGRIQRARQIIQDMSEDLDIKPTVRIYTMLVDGLLIQNKLEGAIQVIEEMKSSGLTADRVLLKRIERFEQDNYTTILSSTDDNDTSNITPV